MLPGTRELYQQLARLAGRRGDLEAPATGSLLARRKRLRDQLRQASGRTIPGLQTPADAALLEELEGVERELTLVAEQMRDLDEEIARRLAAPSPREN